jgi:hypothetical protein
VGESYVDAAQVSVDVRLRLFNETPPESVTVEVRPGMKVVARKLR